MVFIEHYDQAQGVRVQSERGHVGNNSLHVCNLERRMGIVPSSLHHDNQDY